MGAFVLFREHSPLILRKIVVGLFLANLPAKFVLKNANDGHRLSLCFQWCSKDVTTARASEMLIWSCRSCGRNIRKYVITLISVWHRSQLTADGA